MSNEINALQKFFEYLIQNGKNSKDVVDEADANNDDYLTKGEFTKYVKGVGLNLTKDEVSQVYKIFDTKTNGKISGTRLNNRNALDSKEVEEMQAKLDAYKKVRAALDAVCSPEGYQGVKIPQDLKYHVPRASLEASVMANMNSNFEVENLKELLTQAIARTGANGYGQAKFNELLQEAKKNNEVPASYIGDTDFQSLLTAYVRSLGPTAALESIADEIVDIVENYFASAGIGSNRTSDSDLSPYYWDDAQGLNGLQLAVLAKKILGSYDDDAYNKFKSEFDEAIQGFISEECFGMTFDEIVDQLGNFQTSKYGKALEVLITLSDFDALYPDDTSPDDISQGAQSQGTSPNRSAQTLDDKFYNELFKTFGVHFANALASADVNYVESQGLYYNILQTVYRMVMSGEIKNDDDGAIVNKMIELISENYAEFKSGLGLGSSNGDVEDLYNNFNKLYNNDSVAIAVLKDSAIAYLDALSALGNESLNSFIKSTFGDDYKTAIEQLMSKKALQEKIDAVHTKYKELMDAGVITEEVDPFSYKVQNWNSPQDPSCYVGGSAQYFSCTANINPDPSTQTPIPQITYGIETVGGNTGSTATVNPDTGEITFTPGTQDGNEIIKVKVMVNGVEIGTKDIPVTVEKPVFDTSKAGISTGGIQIPVGGLDKGWATSRDNAIANFSTNTVATLKQAAIKQGFDATRAENAAKTLKSYFYGAMHALDNTFGDGLTSKFDLSSKGDNFTYTKYTNEGEIEVTSYDKSTAKAIRDSRFVDDYGNLKNITSETGIYIGCDITGHDDFWVFVNGQKMIDLFASFLV